MKKLSLILILFFFAACSQGSSSVSPSDTVHSFLTHIQMGEYEEAQGLIVDESPLALYEIEEEYRGIFNNLSFGDIVSEEINGASSYVRLTVKALDFASLMEEVMTEAFVWIFSDITSTELSEKIKELLIEKINAEYPPIISSDVSVNLVRQEGRWKIAMDYSFADAVTGGMISFAEYAGQWLS